MFPAHPRTVKQIRRFGLTDQVSFIEDIPVSNPGVSRPHILAVPPLGYLDFLALMSGAGLVLTDSGGIQEETTILGIPCLTLRKNTERPVTITEGTNKLVGNDPELILKEALEESEEKEEEEE